MVMSTTIEGGRCKPYCLLLIVDCFKGVVKEPLLNVNLKNLLLWAAGAVGVVGGLAGGPGVTGLTGTAGVTGTAGETGTPDLKDRADGRSAASLSR